MAAQPKPRQFLKPTRRRTFLNTSDGICAPVQVSTTGQSQPVERDCLARGERSHKGSRVRELFKAAGIKLFFLPLYPPDLNPIEEMFSKLKRLLRKANERTVEATWRRIGKLLDLSPQRMRQPHPGSRICLNLSQKDSSAKEGRR